MIATESKPRTRIVAPSIGLHYGIPFDDYIRWDALSQSDLKSARTMAHLRHRLDAVPEPAGPAQSKGTAFHTLLLEPESFSDRVAICPANPKTGESFGRGTIKWDEWADTEPGKTLISKAEADDIERMATIANQNATVQMLQKSGGAVEVSAVWHDPECGVLCKGRFDLLIVGASKIIAADIKTTENADSEPFGRDAHKYGYVFQQAFYRRAIRAIFPGRAFVPYIVAIETTPPHCLTTYSIDDGTMAVGESAVNAKLAQYTHAVKTNQWPGYEPEQALVLPVWAYRQIESEGING